MTDRPLPLREWVAWTFLNAPVQGTTRPLFYECFDFEVLKDRNVLETDTFLVKALPSEETMAREIVGNRIAQVADLITPEPVIVFVPRRTAAQVDATRRSEGKFSNQRPGRAAGARLFSAWNVIELSEVPEVLRDDALKLYVFDMLAIHTDRTDRNPNCALTSEGLIVYDFERCFVEDDEDSPRDWPLWAGATNGLGPLHMFHNGLRGARNVRQTARRVIRAMSDLRLEACLRGLPRPWQAEGRRIVEHVKLVRDHADEFVDDIERSLSQ